MSDFQPDWILAAKQGDTQAFSNLLEHYQANVYNLCYRMLGDTFEAEDAAQEVFLRAYKGIHRYDPERSFSTWLLSIAAHYCIDRIRQRRIHVASIEELPDQEISDSMPGPETSLVEREEQQRVQSLLGDLNPIDRAVVTLFYWYELSYEEIADILKLTVSAVKSRLHRSRSELAKAWVQQSHQIAGSERRVYEPSTF